MKLRLLLSLALVLALTPGCAAIRRHPAAVADCALQAAADLYQVGLKTYACIGAAPPANAPKVPPSPPAELTPAPASPTEPVPPAMEPAPAPEDSGDAAPE